MPGKDALNGVSQAGVVVSSVVNKVGVVCSIARWEMF